MNRVYLLSLDVEHTIFWTQSKRCMSIETIITLESEIKKALDILVYYDVLSIIDLDLREEYM